MAAPTRRQFVLRSALGFGTYVVAWETGCRRNPPPPSKAIAGPRSPHGTFDASQARTVAAATERILPRDQDPGALDLGVPEYLDRALSDPSIDFLKRPLVTLLDGVEAEARARHYRSFAELASEAADEILARWQRGKPGEQRCFEVLLALTFEGAFGDPKHGGNREGRGYAMIGFQPGPVLPRLPR
jgi:gluconate 2-dehydrogenase gamma chain